MINVLFLSGAVALNLFIGALIIARGGATRFSSFIAAIFGLLAIEQFLFFAFLPDINLPLSTIGIITVFAYYLNGPILLGGVIAGRGAKLGYIWLHVLPASAVVAVFIADYTLALNLLPTYSIKNGLIYTSGQGVLSYLGRAAMLSGILYLGYSAWILHKYKDDYAPVRFRWLSRWVITNSGLLIIAAVLFSPWGIAALGSPRISLSIMAFGFLVQSAYFGFLAIADAPSLIVERDASAKASKFSRERLQLEEYIKNQKPHLDSNLTVAMLAEKLGWSQETLRAVVTTMAGNPTELIVRLRVEEAKGLLESARENETILSLAYSAGFRSKSAFNAAFRKYVGLTPSEYRLRGQK